MNVDASKPMPEQKIVTCVHEAGHVVTAHLKRVFVRKVVIERVRGSGDWNEWYGGTETPLGGQSQRTRRLIAFAGPLAEAKYLAIQGHEQVRFGCLDPLLSHVLSWNAEGNLETELTFATDDGSQRIPLTMFEGDLERLELASAEELDIRAALEEARDILDKDENWELVLKIGNGLANTTVNTVERSRWTPQMLSWTVQQLEKERGITLATESPVRHEVEIERLDQLSGLTERALNGERVILTRGGVPVCKLVPLPPKLPSSGASQNQVSP